MEQVIAEVVKFLTTQGWAGILVLFMGWIIWNQQKDNRELRLRNQALQDLRVADAQDLTGKTLEGISSARATVQALTELIKDRKG